MFRTIQDFLDTWAFESEATLRIFNALTDASLDQRVTPEGRSLRDLAWHITTTINEMMGEAGIQVDGPAYDLPAPATIAEIVAGYQKASAALVTVVPAQLTDDRLAESVPMYGQVWTYSSTLASFVAHQAHHRGQMTVLMRQAGLRVPGIYGPAREDWAAMGMPAMA
jgi:uncharacterized damage-inducible protein DinB